MVYEEERFNDVWTLEETLGKGNFGSISVVRHNSTRRVEAVKILNNQHRAGALKEAHIWESIEQHRNIVKLHEVFEEDDFMFLVMEKCECDVMGRLSAGFRMKEAAPLFKQMLFGIEHLHSLNIVHRDIKFENFLCVGEGFDCIKLCDFGFATLMPLEGQLDDIFGTPPFMSPEMLTRSYDLNTDVWSMGVCCYFLLTSGKFPYAPPVPSSSGMKKAISTGSQITEDFTALRNVTPEAKQFTVTLLNRNAKTRLTAESALLQRFLCPDDCTETDEFFGTPSEASTVASEQDLLDCKGVTPSSSECKDEDGAEDFDQDEDQANQAFFALVPQANQARSSRYHRSSKKLVRFCRRVVGRW